MVMVVILHTVAIIISDLSLSACLPTGTFSEIQEAEQGSMFLHICLNS